MSRKAKQLENLQSTIHHLFAECLEKATKDGTIELNDPILDWNFTERPGVLILESDDSTFEVTIDIQKVQE